MRRFALLTMVALGACGKVGPLIPAAGQSLPVKPLMARDTPDAAKLLQLPTMAKPERVDELLTKSQPRQPDRFDLPPPDAGLAPTSADSDGAPAPSTIGPDNVEPPR